MAPGQGAQAPTNVTHYLKGMEFPARRDDLLQHAKNNDAESGVLEMIECMPDMEFQNMADVMHAYGEADREMGRDDDRGRRRH